MIRRPLIVGNWKLHGSKQLVGSLFSELQQRLLPCASSCDVAVAPPALFLGQASELLLGPPYRLALAAQNIDTHDSGAFTGEIAASMLLEFGVTYVIIGHSERRRHHQESNALIAKKFIQVKRAGLIPILCLGETEGQRSRGETEQVCGESLAEIFRQAGLEALRDTVIAYEPVWAIGSGRPATAEQAQAVHKFIRSLVAQQDPTLAPGIRLLYGGSVTEQNVANLYNMPDIDGFLVGGASLQASSFANIVQKITELG